MKRRQIKKCRVTYIRRKEKIRMMIQFQIRKLLEMQSILITKRKMSEIRECTRLFWDDLCVSGPYFSPKIGSLQILGAEARVHNWGACPHQLTVLGKPAAPRNLGLGSKNVYAKCTKFGDEGAIFENFLKIFKKYMQENVFLSHFFENFASGGFFKFASLY